MFDVHQFLSRLDWPFFQASGPAYMKLQLNISQSPLSTQRGIAATKYAIDF